MTAPERRRAKRLLIVPILLFAAIIAVVIAVPTFTDRAPDEAQPVDGLPPLIAGDDQTCQRDTQAPDLVQERAPLVAERDRVASAMIFACPELFDGLRVGYTGEVIGDVLYRDGGAWALVNDDDYALVYGPLPTHREHRGTNSGLSVWLPDDLLDEITGLGRPNQRGDVVHLEGYVRRTDPDDGGGLTLRADHIQILQPAAAVDEPVDRPQAALAVVSVLAGAGLWSVRRRTSR